MLLNQLILFILQLLALFAGGFFSSLGAVTKTITPADNLAANIEMLQPGDTLILRGGHYPGLDSNSVRFPSGNSWSDAPRIQAFQGETVILGGTNIAAPSGTGQSSIRYIIFDGINFVPSSGQDGLSFWGAANHIRLTNFSAHGARVGKLGINLQPGPGGGGFNEFINGKVYDNTGANFGGTPTSGTTAHGMYVGSFNNLIERVEFYGNGHLGLQCYSDKVAPSNNIIRNCIFHNNGVTYTTSGAGVTIGGGSGNQVIDSTIFNERGGIWVCCSSPAGQPSGTLIQNNKLYNNVDFDIYIQSGSGTIVKDNCLNTSKIINNGSGTTLQNNSQTACSGGSSTTSQTTVDPVTLVQPQQQQPSYSDYPSSPSSTSQPSGPSTSQVSAPFLIAGVILAALVLGD